MLTVFPSAYGNDGDSLIVTHINVDPAYYEGSGAIYTTSADGMLGSYGSFSWWYVFCFEWSEDEGCYILTEVHNTVNSGKSSVKIPENGFCYCVNEGNDYPALYASDPVQWAVYADPVAFPDYTTEAVSDSFNYAKSLKKGTKVYLYGIDLASNYIVTNSALWYTEDFKSDAYITVGAPDESGTPYSPDGSTALEAEYSLGINAINNCSGEGQATILTPDWGVDTYQRTKNTFPWWKLAVFEWNEYERAYILTELDLSTGSVRDKCAIIPKNGFVLAVNLGNNYASSGGVNYINQTATYTFEKLSLLKPGAKAYLTGIDIEEGTFEYTGNIYKYYDDKQFSTNGFINILSDEPEEYYIPETIGQKLGDIEFTTENNLFTPEAIDIKWKSVPRAESYTVYLCNSTSSTLGSYISSTDAQASGDETVFTVDGESLEVGCTYSLRVYAEAKNYDPSPIGVYTFRLASERATTSPFRDKTIVAFGDSITEAVGGWVGMLFGELGVDVINAGVGGDTTAHALARIEGEVISYSPDLVIVNFGMNDQSISSNTGTNLVPLEDYERNYRSIIEQLQECGTEILLVAPHDVYKPYASNALNYATGAIDSYCEVVKRLAEEYGTGFLNINALAESELAAITASVDGIHLSNYGNKKYCAWIADCIYESFSDLGEDTDESTESGGASPDASDDAENEPQADAEDSWTVTVAVIVMFVGICVFGVLFIKSVQKDKNKLH